MDNPYSCINSVRTKTRIFCSDQGRRSGTQMTECLMSLTQIWAKKTVFVQTLNNMAVFFCFQDATCSGFQQSIKNEEIAYICGF